MTCWRCDGKGSYPLGIIVGNGEWTTVQKQCPDCNPPAEYLEASRIAGRNALVETDPPEVVAAARAVCDACTGIERAAPAGSESEER